MKMTYDRGKNQAAGYRSLVQMRFGIATVAAVALTFSPAALADHGRKPVNPAASQYVEMLPTATGSTPTGAARRVRATPELQRAAGSDAVVIASMVASQPAPTSAAAGASKPGATEQRSTPRSAHRPAGSPRRLPADGESFASAASGTVGGGAAGLVVLALIAGILPLALLRLAR
jgi:hypothetical protein